MSNAESEEIGRYVSGLETQLGEAKSRISYLESANATAHARIAELEKLLREGLTFNPFGQSKFIDWNERVESCLK